ncbi:hypothetical protein DD238_000843 [Peronospora effusa]|uniref:SET domain-containing protein n=1 Tax=Peronospora effusa TaxID=542832 RepID=A0A3M6V7Q6_9STRA|nr:hypothetical protein DD238_000843 [Peronospora effusa]RQM18307.1 hypothetical protein DD237_000066 [Peronospora effusa]
MKLYALYVILTQALYPGIVYLPEHYKKVIWCEKWCFCVIIRLEHHISKLSDNPYARARFDSVIIDAKNESSSPRNPLAVAHKINHPPSGTSPNVIGFAFEFPPEGPFATKEFDELIPNSFVQEPSRLSMFGKRAIVHGLAFIAVADIADEEELFLNYRVVTHQSFSGLIVHAVVTRYNPDRLLPKWYTSIDADSDRAMWK